MGGIARRFATLPLLIVVVIALAASGSSSKTSSTGSSKSSGGANPPEADVVVAKCALSDNEFMGPEATLTVTNHSSKPSNYLIDVQFESQDGKTLLDTGHAAVNGLVNGQTTTEQAPSLKRELRASGGAFTCRVSKVTRLAA